MFDRDTGRHARVLLATGLFAAAQLAIVIGGFADNGALCDDAFYYFQIAKHAAQGNGFSFDGLYATNGFHPLFGWLAVPAFALTSSAWLPIRALLALLGLATAATGYVLYRIGRSLGDERAGELMALLFLLSPFTWIIPLRGCEGGLEVLCVALALWQAASMEPHRESAALPAGHRSRPSMEQHRDSAVLPAGHRSRPSMQAHREIATLAALKLGALVGLAGLARTENVFLAVGMAAWLLTRTRRPRPLVAFASAAALVVSPWLIWNLARFGTVMQVSGAAKSAFHLTHGLPFGLRHLISNLYDVARVPTQFIVGEDMQPTQWTDALVLVNAAIVAVAVVAGGRRRAPLALAPLAVLVTLHVAYYVLVQRSYFNWYVMPLVLGAAALQGERLARAATRVIACVLVASALVCVATLGAFFHRYPREPHAPEQRVAGALELIDTLPFGAHAGAWNVGAIGYFGMLHRPDVAIVNLDCVVDNELFAAWRRGEYTKWVVANVGWLVERPSRPLDAAVAVPVRDGLWRIVQ